MGKYEGNNFHWAEELRRPKTDYVWKTTKMQFPTFME